MAGYMDGNATPGSSTGVQSVASLSTAADLNKHVDRIKSSRSRMENQWQLNLNFFNGKQYCYYSPTLNKIVSLPTQEGEKPRYRIRVTSNQILKNSLKLLAKVTKTKPSFAATPGSGDPAAIKAAQVSESLAEHWWFELQLARKYAEAFLLAIIMGSGFLFATYDKLYGDPQTYLMEPGPDGQPSDKPIVNDGLKQLFIQQLEQAGIPIETYQKTIYPGELSVEVLDPRNVYLDTARGSAEAARWWVIRRHLDPVEIKSRWGKEFEADSVPDGGEPLTIFSTETQVYKSTKAVYCMYLLPGPESPKGRYVCWADDTILEDGPFPYKSGMRNLIRIGSLRHPLNPYGTSVVEHAIDDQKEYNRVLSKIIEALMLMMTPRMLAPVGSVRGRVTNEPGLVVEYAGQTPPTWEEMKSIPPYVFEHSADIKARLDEDFFVNEIGDGTPPPNVEAGIAIDLLQEAASDSFAPMVLDNEHALSRLLMVLLDLARTYYTEPRMLQITGLNGSSRLQSFKMGDMTPGTRISVETGSSLPRTKAARMAMVLELGKQGVIPPDKMWKYLDMPDLKGLTMKMQADEDQALREHDRLLQGQPINGGAFQMAMQAAQSPDPQTGVPINPKTNQPFQGVEEMQEFLKNAALQPFDFENTASHLDVHSSYMKSIEFEQLPHEIKQDFETHYGLSLDRYISMNPLPENVRVSHQIKSSIGPTAASQVLTQAGVQGITPEIMMEPPLETVVMDVVDNPDDPNAQAAPQVHAAEVAKQEAQMAQQQMAVIDQQHAAHEQRQQQAAAHDQQMSHAHTLHAQKVAHNEQAQEAKLKQLAKPKVPAGQQ